MKKILLILCLFPILVFSQKSYKIPADSTILNNIGSGKNELVIRNATSNITGGILTNLGNGVTAFVLGGGSARVVDTIYKNSAKDSIVFTISGIRYAVKDSIGVTDLSGYALQISLNDTANTLRRIRKVDSSYLFKNATRDSICMVTVINGNTYRTCAFDSSNVNTDSQSLQLFFTDSILLGITRGNSIKFAYAVDSVGLNAGGDSIVVIKAGLRKGYAIGSSGSGASLSGLTAATATNTINNAANAQEWQWNSLSSGIGLKLSSTSTNAASNGAILSVERTGTIAAVQTNYCAKFINTITNVSGFNTCILATSTGTGTRRAIEIGGGNIHFSANGTAGGDNSITFNGGGYISSGSVYGLQLKGYLNKATWLYSGTSNNMINIMRAESGYSAITHSFNSASVTRSMLMFGGDWDGVDYRAASTSAAVIEHNAGSLVFSANSGTAGGFNTFTPNEQLTIYATNNNVGIGTTTPVASAKLQITSTTQGFLPPRMTATQASAIASPAQGLMLFVTDTNGTFTSVGWWGYNGATWEKLNN